MQNDQHLEALLATHAEALQALLPAHLWPIRPFEVKQYGPLTKYTLGQLPDGRWAHLHYLREPDGGEPHCHPTQIESNVIQGGYYERIFSLDEEGYVSPCRVTLRMPGPPHMIEADCIHQIMELLPSPCWTCVFTGPVIREWQHYPVRR